MIIALVALLSAALVVGFGILLSMAPHPRPPTENERFFTHVLTGEKIPFKRLLDSQFPISTETPKSSGRRTSPRRRPNTESDSSSKDGGPDSAVDLSVIIPAFNEKDRLPIMLNEALDYLDARHKANTAKTFEVIVVDDGSRDETSAVAAKIAKERNCANVRILTLEMNRGKGGAVTQGMLVARGEKLLFADADGASKFSDVEKLEIALSKVSKNGQGVAVGSRAHMVKSEAVVKRSFVRNFLMHGFHTFLLLLGIAEIKDTQCGFKMLMRSSAIEIFPHMHVEGWIFDIEMLLLASWHKIPIVEVPVTWNEVGGSKVSLLRDSIRMAIDLVIIRVYYATGMWSAFPKANKKDKSE